MAFARKQARYARYALVYALVYLSLGVVQRERAESVALALAEERGHIPTRLTVKPTIGNRYLWRLIYEYEGRYYVDAATVGWNKVPIRGASIDKLDVASDYPWLPPDSIQARDIERFRWFSDGFIARNPDNNLMIMDVRYSLLPNELKPLWVIHPRPDSQEPPAVSGNADLAGHNKPTVGGSSPSRGAISISSAYVPHCPA
jgi:inner membrane protein